MSWLQAPFPYYGGKSAIAPVIWRALGDVPNYAEPFFGSGAVLLARPERHQWWDRTETANDLDGLCSNFWRAVQADPDAVAKAADWPCLENDLHARHAWLVGQKESLQARLEGDPDWFDAKAAGWWVWGMCCWIGGGWCSGEGPWHLVEGKLVKVDSAAGGVKRQRVHLGDAGQGINRKLVHLGDAGRGINRKLVHLGDAGRGINGKLVHLGDAGLCAAWSEHLRNMMQALQNRLRRVRVCCGDWTRVLGPSPTIKQGLTGIFLDPPYAQSERDDKLYRVEMETAAAVCQWCREHGGHPLLRIAICGYVGEHDLPGWRQWRWKAHGGYSNLGHSRGRENAKRECVWFSPRCLDPGPGRQLELSLDADVD